MTLTAELKARANKAFNAGKYSIADGLYSEALVALLAVEDGNAVAVNGSGTGTIAAAEAEKAETTTVEASNDEAANIEAVKAEAVLLGNRANARLKLEMYAAAIDDATQAVQKNPKYLKGYYRRGSALFALGKYKQARRDFLLLAKQMPNELSTRHNLSECEKRIRESAFARAIESSEQRVYVADTLDVSTFTVADTYEGPRLPDDGTVTEKFVHDLIDHFRNQKKLHIKYAAMIILSAKRIMDALPNIVTVPVNAGNRITVCGDVHGQYYDLANAIFASNGLPSAANPYVFNGDFVDRGSFSVEVILTLLAVKVWCPEAIHLTRGNHESQNMNRIYGFEGEVKAKYTNTLYQLFSELFQSLPLAYILDGHSGGDEEGDERGRRAFIVHGGLFSRDGVTLDEIQALDRRVEPDHGLVAEMLWSDPQEADGWGLSKRGIGVAFGPDVTHRFLDANGLDLVVRSHEMKDTGYEVGADGRLITIFSAPNYCDQMGNQGAYIVFDHTMNPDFRQFSAVPHPNVRPMQFATYGTGLGM